jgi:hypothetical protein
MGIHAGGGGWLARRRARFNSVWRHAEEGAGAAAAGEQVEADWARRGRVVRDMLKMFFQETNRNTKIA